MLLCSIMGGIVFTTTQSPSASLLENIRRMTYDLDIAKMQDLDVTNKNRRGFTDHEHLNEQQLIHMNGRVYDYNLGRFMSVDPFIQSPTSTQSVNPYSYIMNNPLAGTDPTGYCSTKDSVAGCSDSLGEGEFTDITEGGKVVGTVGR
jgi:RHS repeat-associated protein